MNSKVAEAFEAQVRELALQIHLLRSLKVSSYALPTHAQLRVTQNIERLLDASGGLDQDDLSNVWTAWSCDDLEAAELLITKLLARRAYECAVRALGAHTTRPAVEASGVGSGSSVNASPESTGTSGPAVPPCQSFLGVGFVDDR